MNKVFVLDKNKVPLMPCHPARARELLTKGRAAVYRTAPFTIILKDRTVEDSVLQPLELKLDPGAKTTGIAINAWFKIGAENKQATLIFGANLTHRAFQMTLALTRRRKLRRSRRGRKCRYRKKRFNNRKNKKEGWIAPSVHSILDNIEAWINKLIKLAPIKFISAEINKFDTQKLENPAISGVQYQQGTLYGYNIRQYVFTRDNHTCVYCGTSSIKTGIKLNVDHVIPESKGGTYSVGNLVTSCIPCNKAKDKLDLNQFVKDRTKLAAIKANLKKPLKDTAYVNILRKKLMSMIENYGLLCLFGDGATTKFNRVNQGYQKDHFIDAACSIEGSGANVYIKPGFKPLLIQTMGRGDHQAQGVDEYGFPKGKATRHKRFRGFNTGDIVQFTHTKTKKNFRVIPREKGSFNITDLELRAMLKYPNVKLTKRQLIQGVATFKTGTKAQIKALKLPTSISPKYLKLVQRNDGYKYSYS